ncbi:unnamed protein product [Durusdinium trenchii]|uniref:Uncharacterized protein n=1 Tax=Durusdinium trenchii TaxID=1381693 RepID=A0ABP0SFW9_9DINO
MESKYSKSKARQDAIKPALAFFCGLGSVFLVLHCAFSSKAAVGRAPTQAQTALASLSRASRAGLRKDFRAELPEAFRSFQGPNEPQLRSAHFVLGEENSDACPEGYVFLADPESCEIASQVMKYRYNGDQRIATDPAGCLYRTPDRDIMWNQEKGGTANAVRKRVCLEVASLKDLPNIPDAPPPTPQQSVQSVEQPQAPAEAVEIGEAPVVKQRSEDGQFILTDTEQNRCPSGTQALQSKEDCVQASQSFQKKFLSETLRAELEPKNCVYRSNDEDLFWNADPEGAPHENRQVVCATEDFKRGAASPASPASVTDAMATTGATAATVVAAAAAEIIEATAAPARFVMGDLGEIDCPAGSVPLEDSEACEQAATFLSKEYVELNEAEGDPKGCQYRPPDQDVYFNSHDRGAPNPARQPICKEDPQAAAQRPTAKPALEFNHEYVLGEPETTDCPAGGQPVESADECGVAAKKLGKMYLGEQNPAEMDPKGCQFRIPDQDIYFNPHPTGATHADRQPICRS